MDIISIHNIMLDAEIGAYPQERGVLQPLCIHVHMGFDASEAAQSDNVHKTIDYCVVTESIIRAVQATQFHLLERLAMTVMDVLLAQPLCQWCKVELQKPDVLKQFHPDTTANVIMERTRAS